MIVRLTLIIIFILFFTYCKQDLKPPERNKNIPIEAIWYGGVDGGCWINIKPTKIDNQFDAVIYFEYDGSIWEKDLYKLCESCKSKNLAIKELKESIITFNGEVILLKVKNNNKYCTLEKVLENKDVFCLQIDTLVDERRVTNGSNYFANQIIPVLENESGIEANCQKGTYGYIYSSDSSFNADIEKWKKYFNCK